MDIESLNFDNFLDITDIMLDGAVESETIRYEPIKGKGKKKTGRYTPNYTEKFPFWMRDYYDFFEDRVLWDDWNDCRDGMRDFPPYGSYGNKPKMTKNKLRVLNSYEYSSNSEYIRNAKKWNKKRIFRKIRKNKINMFNSFQNKSEVL